MLKLKLNSMAALTAMAAAGLMAIAVPAPSLAQPAATAAAPYAPQTSAVAAEDLLAIHDLIARMNQAIDANDYAAYAAFYSPDGVIDSGFGPPNTGRAAILDVLKKSAPFISNKRHVPSNIVINRSAQGLTAVFYLTVFERETGLTIAGTALITDEFKRRASGGWEVVRHTTRMDPATLRAMQAAMSRTGS
jgi:ketosteroid isomerase-like protein